MHGLIIGVLGLVPGADDPKQLLDELSAGCDANVVRIERGSAEYGVKHTATDFKATRDPAKAPARPSEYRASIHFSGEIARWDYADHRCIKDHRSQTEYRVYGPKLASVHHIAITYAVGEAPTTPYDFHPRAIGHSVSTISSSLLTVADLIRKNRGKPGMDLVATREGELIKLTVTWQEALYKAEMWVSPSQGYGVTRQVDWALADPRMPCIERTTQYKQVGGVFVAERHTAVDRVLIGGEYREALRRELILNKIDLGSEPGAKLFTVDGLGLPRGARVLDKRTGETYLYGVKATTQKEIEDAVTDILLHGESSKYIEPLWRRIGRYLLWGSPLLLCGAVVSVVWRRSRRRPKGGVLNPPAS